MNKSISESVIVGVNFSDKDQGVLIVGRQKKWCDGYYQCFSG